jgi:hypothetical protein
MLLFNFFFSSYSTYSFLLSFLMIVVMMKNYIGKKYGMHNLHALKHVNKQIHVKAVVDEVDVVEDAMEVEVELVKNVDVMEMILHNQVQNDLMLNNYLLFFVIVCVFFSIFSLFCIIVF